LKKMWRCCGHLLVDIPSVPKLEHP
jgi:hypothetical protein